MTTTEPAFQPRVTLVTAERHVDYQRILNHILTRRARVERTVAPTARRLGWLAVHQPHAQPAQTEALTNALERALATTADFGYREARAELGRLRYHHPVATAAYHVPDAGAHARTSGGGLDAIRALILARARATAADVAQAARAAAAGADQNLAAAVQVAAAAAAATRVLHNHVLELVGETLNLGRAAGIDALNQPPEYAMRSEQLDQNTCDECDQLHGEIVEIGSDAYYDLMPPARCLGGGRCRGIYVYGDEPVQLQQAA